MNINANLQQLLSEHSAAFDYDEGARTWCLYEATGSGLYWETDDTPADSLAEAQTAAIEYLRALDAIGEMQDIEARARVAEDAEYLERAALAEEQRMARDYDGVNLLTVEQVAEMKECHPETVRRALRSGEFGHPRKVGNGLWLLDAREAEAWNPRPVGRPAEKSFDMEERGEAR